MTLRVSAVSVGEVEANLMKPVRSSFSQFVMAIMHSRYMSRAATCLLSAA
jgi:hypothetical protein